MKRRILFVIDSLQCGGAEKSLTSLLPLLDRDKYEVSLWPIARGGVFESLLPDWIKILNAPHYGWAGRIKLKLALVAYSLLYRILKALGISRHGAETYWTCVRNSMKVPEGKWDTVIAYQQGLPTYLVASHFAGSRKIAWVNADIFKAGYRPDWNLRYYNKIDKIVNVSESLDRIMRQKLPQLADKYAVVYDILNPELIREMSDLKVTDLRRDKDERVIVTVGRLAAPKNYPLAVDTAAELKRQGIKFCWYFVGEGPERATVEKRITERNVQDCVTLLGLQANPYPFMKQADVYVQTSSFEGFGLTIGEAKILHLPIVSTNFDVVYNQLTPGVDGLVTEMNPSDLAGAITRILTDEALRQTLLSALDKEHNTTYLSEVGKVETLLDA